MSSNDYTVPDPTHSALLIIDVQRDFALRGAIAEIPDTMQAVPCIQRIVKQYREQKLPIIHIIRLYLSDGFNVDLCRRKDIENGKQIVVLGSDGADLLDELKPLSSIKLDSNLLLSGSLQQIGDMEWITVQASMGSILQYSIGKTPV